MAVPEARPGEADPVSLRHRGGIETQPLAFEGPMAESAATSRRCNGDGTSPATSGTRRRIHAATGPLPHVPRAIRTSTAEW